MCVIIRDNLATLASPLNDSFYMYSPGGSTGTCCSNVSFDQTESFAARYAYIITPSLYF